MYEEILQQEKNILKYAKKTTKKVRKALGQGLINLFYKFEDYNKVKLSDDLFKLLTQSREKDN